MGCGALRPHAHSPGDHEDGGRASNCGMSSSKRRRPSGERARRFSPIPARFKTLAEVTKAVRVAGLESSNLIIGVDFTKSNLWTGAQSFEGTLPRLTFVILFPGKSLHDLWAGRSNPYQRARVPIATLSEVPCLQRRFLLLVGPCQTSTMMGRSLHLGERRHRSKP